MGPKAAQHQSRFARVEPPRLTRPAVDLRLWPLAATMWCACAVVLSTRSLELAWTIVVGLLALAVLSLAAARLRTVGPALATVGPVTGVGAAAAVATTASRIHRANHHDVASWQGSATTIRSRLIADPTPTSADDTHMLRLSVPELPADLTVFAHAAHTEHLGVGNVVAVTGQVAAASRPGISPVTMSTNAPIEIVGEPNMLFGFAASARTELAQLAADTLSQHTAGLVTGMVFGDVRPQPAVQRQYLLDAGLAHLSAVSGANVTIVSGCALTVAAFLGATPKVRVAVAALALAAYVLVTGPEPSVLRASVMGGVSLVAIASSRRNQPLSALAAGIIVLLLCYPNLAVNWGFGLSVGVTLGLILLAPFIRRGLLRLHYVNKLPDVVVGALAVAIAAEIVSIPLLIGMSGTVPIGSVVANLLASAAVAPVTVLGLVAAIALWVPGVGPPVATVALWLAWPCAAWIDWVAATVAAVPGAVVEVAQ